MTTMTISAPPRAATMTMMTMAMMAMMAMMMTMMTMVMMTTMMGSYASASTPTRVFAATMLSIVKRRRVMGPISGPARRQV